MSNRVWCYLVLLQFSCGAINLGSIVLTLLCGRAGRAIEPSWSWGCQGLDFGGWKQQVAPWGWSGTAQVWWGSENSSSIYSRARGGSRSFRNAPSWLWNHQGLVLLWDWINVWLPWPLVPILGCPSLSPTRGFHLLLCGSVLLCSPRVVNGYHQICGVESDWFGCFCCFWMPGFCAEKENSSETW